MDLFADIFVAAWMIVFAAWGVNQRWYSGLSGAWRRKDPNMGWTYVGWRRQALRALAVLIAALMLIDF